ncbi:thioesterase II family protein [Nostoc sp. C117]|uniref:thioesterase II family protein n=1 Tax=Nostoc sp. C117 TaxID=3349875 RepID=UPI00370DB980
MLETKYLLSSPPRISSWVCSQPNPQARIRLFCFPHGGSGPHAFRNWHKFLPESIEVYGLQLPGRGSRLRETPFTSMESLVQVLVTQMTPDTDKPFAFFGHSLGANICFEVTRQLQRQGNSYPVHLFIASCRAPQLPKKITPFSKFSDIEFIEHLRRANSVPEEILQNPKLIQLFLPALRSDAELEETYIYHPDEPFDCPISAFGGMEDTIVTQQEIAAWRYQTRNSFLMEMFPGDHFFINNQLAPLLKSLSEQLQQYLCLNSMN